MLLFSQNLVGLSLPLQSGTGGSRWKQLSAKTKELLIYCEASYIVALHLISCTAYTAAEIEVGKLLSVFGTRDHFGSTKNVYNFSIKGTIFFLS